MLLTQTLLNWDQYFQNIKLRKLYLKSMYRLKQVQKRVIRYKTRGVAERFMAGYHELRKTTYIIEV